MLGKKLLSALDDAKIHKIAQRQDLKERFLRCRRQNPDMTISDLRRRFGISLTLARTFVAEAEE
jgi:hypothetical protein